ncbi:hypothetical protein [Roseivivax sediminis]|uniref:Uncharacterized protein n=1 Tax=Roseivivax sediminis TaxID=936889 RepID=A0A1I1SCQ7_9RHOB|nr:hypothetical protein [Roseivivax sediminis]SFD44269.1 hypothetical protein SAMN04515678_101100 [Roseivivax sediminis]
MIRNAALLAVFGAPASAELALDAPETCLARARADGPVTAARSGGTEEARTAGTRARLPASRDDVRDHVTAIRGTEGRYGALAGFVPCDRTEALARHPNARTSEIVRTRCEARASGPAYARLFRRGALSE